MLFTIVAGSVMGPIALTMMLLGLYAARLKTVENMERFVKKLGKWGLIIGLPATVLYVFMGLRESALQSVMMAVPLFAVGGPALSFFYMASIVVLLQKTQWQKRLTILAPVGRMALTNYLMQSLICSTLSYGYGFSLYGRSG
jgi:uncharacterized protein